MHFSESIAPTLEPGDKKRQQASPPVLPEIDLSRDTPFGSFNQVAARRTFAFLIATLNATYSDYDFANTLRPADFVRTSGTSIKSTLDTALYNLRPRRLTTTSSPTSKQALSSSAPQQLLPMPEVVWDESMWSRLDMEMDLKHCEKYSWEPEDNPFIENNSLWSKHFMIYNKDKKRVCYIQLSAYSAFSHSPLSITHATSVLLRHRRRTSVRDGPTGGAQYLLGYDDLDEAAMYDDVWDDDDIEDMDTDEYSEGEYTEDLDDVREHIQEGHYKYVEPAVWVPPPEQLVSTRGDTLANPMEL